MLLAWGEENTRAFPWRHSTDPYLVLVSEFMLHRTQVKQVTPVFEIFTRAFPDLRTLLKSDEKKIQKILSPLGLQWRIDGMIAALKEIQIRYDGVPTDYDQLIAVRGIGPYIAGATVCFTTNRPLPLIDTNTVRVTGRVQGLDLSGEARRRKEITLAIEEICDPDHPRDFYYAMIDLAHELCRPENPQCEDCPLLSVPCNYGQSTISKRGGL
ncbi:MAG: DNA-binding protein [Chloroflexi bacterium]|nr:DNA-binding protein [Chloroflexota bacterium]